MALLSRRGMLWFAAGLYILLTIRTASAQPMTEPPAISKAFSPDTVPVGGTSTLTFTISNPNMGTTLTGIGFTDPLPAGVVVALSPALVVGPTCFGAGVMALPESPVITLLPAMALPAPPVPACTISVHVTGLTPGTKVNTTSAITSANGGTGNTAMATLTVVARPVITKAFGAASIPLDGTTSLTVTITNTNATTALTGVGYSDVLPVGLAIIVVNPASGCGSATFSFTLGVPHSDSFSMTGGTIAPSGSCTLVLTVKGTTGGVKSNTTSAVTSTEGGTGTTSNTASVTVVVAPPTISKSFGAAEIPLGGTTSLTLTITNSNPLAPLTGVGFTDTLPAGLALTLVNAESGCGSPFLSFTIGVPPSDSVSMTGATIAPGGSCIIPLGVTGTTVGLKTNTTSTVTSTEGGTGAAAMASVTVFDGPDVTISKSHTGSFVRGEEGAQYSITVRNTGSKPTSGTVTVTDALPAGLTATAISGAGWACILGTLTCTRSDALAVGSSYPVIILTVNVNLSTALLVTNTATVSGGGDLNPNNNTATDPTAVLPCAAHTVHSHVTTTPPDAHNGDSHIHHGQHDHNILPGTECLPPGHHVTVAGHILGLTQESQGGLFSRDSLAAAGPDFVAILNQDGNPAPAQRGTVIQLFGSANGFFFDSADQDPVLHFRPPASGLPLYYTTSLPEVLIGEVPGEVLFSGLAPGLEGVWQINVRIPDGVSPGKVPVTIFYEGGALRSVDLSVE